MKRVLNFMGNPNWRIFLFEICYREKLYPLLTFPGDKCPRCNEGTIKRYFTRLGICFAVLCFPIGISCCFFLREKRCTGCGETFEEWVDDV